MFDFEGWWFWGFVALPIVSIASGKYKSRKLLPKQKSLSELSFSITIFGFMTMFLIFNLLISGSTYIPQKFDSLEEARKILAEYNKSLFNLKFSIYFFFFYLSVWILPAIYNFAKEITPNDKEKILDLKVDEKKPILRLNDE